MAGNRRRCPRAPTANPCRRSPVRGPRRRDNRQRAVPRPGDRCREVQARRPAFVLRHARRLPSTHQPIRAPASPHRAIDADRRTRVQGRAQGIPALRTWRGAGRAQPRRIRHVARRAWPGEPARAPDHRHVLAGETCPGPAEGADARARHARRGTGPRRHAGARRARRRARDRDGFSSAHRPRPGIAGLEHIGRRAGGNPSAARRRPDAA